MWSLIHPSRLLIQPLRIFTVLNSSSLLRISQLTLQPQKLWPLFQAPLIFPSVALLVAVSGEYLTTACIGFEDHLTIGLTAPSRRSRCVLFCLLVPPSRFAGPRSRSECFAVCSVSLVSVLSGSIERPFLVPYWCVEFAGLCPPLFLSARYWLCVRINWPYGHFFILLSTCQVKSAAASFCLKVHYLQPFLFDCCSFLRGASLVLLAINDVRNLG